MYLGLTETAFWKLTPRKYHALMARHRELEEHREMGFAVVAHTIATFAGKSLKDGKELTFGDFMPSQRGKKKAQKAQSVEAVSSLRAFFETRKVAAEQKQQRIKGERIA